MRTDYCKVEPIRCSSQKQFLKCSRLNRSSRFSYPTSVHDICFYSNPPSKIPKEKKYILRYGVKNVFRVFFGSIVFSDSFPAVLASAAPDCLLD